MAKTSTKGAVIEQRAWRVQLDGTKWMIVICPHPVNEIDLKAILSKQFKPQRITQIGTKPLPNNTV